MNYQELSELFTDCLKKKLLGTKYDNNREICDVDVSINENSIEYEGGGEYYNEINIRVKTLSPQGKNSEWYDFI